MSNKPLALALVCLAIAFSGGLDAGAHAQSIFTTGTYVGNAADNRSISGLGFQPDVIMLKGNASPHGVIRTSTMVGDATKKPSEPEAFRTNRIQTLDVDGFTIGTNAAVNTNAVDYYWVAFQAQAGELTVGTYTGDGIDGRDVTGVGFQPDYVIVMNAGAEEAVVRSSSMVGDLSFKFRQHDGEANFIQALTADGFEVGTDMRVNRSGDTYHYIAWRASSGRLAVGTYAGDGNDDRTIGTAFDGDYLQIVGTQVNTEMAHRTIDVTGDQTMVFENRAFFGNGIQSIAASGFEVGSDPIVNQLDRDYYWAVFGEAQNAPPVCDAGGPYAGDLGADIAFDGSGSTDADGTITAYDWDFGDGNAGTGATPTHAYATAGTFTVTLCVTDDDGAVSCCTTTADVNAPPVCDAGDPYAGDVGADIAFDGTGSTDADGTITAYDWDFGDGNAGTGATPTHAYATAGTFTVTLCVTDDDGAVSCCTTTADVNAPPVCDAGDPYAGDVGADIAFDGTGSTDADGTITAYDWDFGDGNVGTGATPTHAYATAGTFTVTLCVTDDDGAVSCCTTTADVNAPPVCDAGGPYAGDVGADIAFDGTGSTDADGTITAYDWDFGDGNVGTGPTPTHVYATAGTFDVTLCVTDDDGAVSCCTTTATASENAPPVCDAGGPYAGDVGADIAFDGTGSTDADGTITAYDWDFGDGNVGTGPTPTHAYATAGTFDVTLCVTDDDGAVSCCTTTADVNAPPVCDAGGPYAGQVGVDIVFDGSLSTDADGTITAYDWDFGDGNAGTGALVTHAYAAAGTFDVTLCVTDDDGAVSCCATTATISDNAPPVCDAGGPYAGDLGADIAFDGSGSTDADGTITAYDWDFGDGNAGTGALVTHAYAAAGTFDVTLCVTDDDGAVSCCTTTVEVDGPPVCDAGGPYVGGIGNDIQFDGTGSSEVGGAITAYDWDFGDGGTGSGATPIHVYDAAGVYDVTLCVTDDDGDITCCATEAIIDNVIPDCDADGPYAGTVGNDITFDGSGSSDADGTIVLYSWDFGDGETGTGVNATHAYALPGTYTVTLCVTDDDDGVACCTSLATITEPPVCDAGGPYDALVADTITFDGSASTGTIVDYAWDFGDGETGTGVNADHAYAAAGLYTVTLCVTDDVGAESCCTTTATAREWTDVTTGVLGDEGNGRGVAWGDYDGDGDPDLYLANSGVNRLYENQNGTFVDVTSAPLDDSGDGLAVAWGDYDRDGDLDLYHSRGLAPSENLLFRNDGGGTFVEVANGTPAADPGNARSVAWVDHDLDGDVDLYIANVLGANRLLRNEGGTFVPTGVLEDTQGTQGVAWGDYDGDGDPDLFVANGNAPNRLFRNDLSETFVDIAPGTPLEDATAFTLGCAWADIENDGDLDVYATNNSGPNRLFLNEGDGGGGLWTFVEAADGTPLADLGDGRGLVFGDFDNDADQDVYVANVNGINRYLRNDGGGAFSDATFLPLDDAGDSFGVASADYDGDGDLDLFVANSASANKLYRNDAAALDRHWLHVDLAGVLSNLDGIGARVRVEANGAEQIREVSGGAGWLSHGSLTQEFGLDDAGSVTRLTVFWPSGVVQDTAFVATDQRLLLVERESTAGVEDGEAAAPLAFGLAQNVPNPFNPVTRITYDVPSATDVRLSILDVGGRLVRRLVDGTRHGAGRYTVVWDGRAANGQLAPSGVYLYRLQASGREETRRMLLLK